MSKVLVSRLLPSVTPHPRPPNSVPFGSARALGTGAVSRNVSPHSSHAGIQAHVRVSEKKAEIEARQGRGRTLGAATPVNPAGVVVSHAGQFSRDYALEPRPDRRGRDVEAHGADAASVSTVSTVEEQELPEMNLTVSILALFAVTGLTYLTAEALTDSLSEIGRVCVLFAPTCLHALILMFYSFRAVPSPPNGLVSFSLPSLAMPPSTSLL
jgi:Ca2+:H+ antiporter